MHKRAYVSLSVWLTGSQGMNYTHKLLIVLMFLHVWKRQKIKSNFSVSWHVAWSTRRLWRTRSGFGEVTLTAMAMTSSFKQLTSAKHSCHMSGGTWKSFSHENNHINIILICADKKGPILRSQLTNSRSHEKQLCFYGCTRVKPYIEFLL